MSWFVVDIECDWPIPGPGSMFSFGCIRLTRDLNDRFLGLCKPISDKFEQRRLDLCHTTREQCLTYPDPKDTMLEFKEFIEKTNKKGRPIFISDNVGDFAWINWYFHYFLGDNPFGWSGRRIADLYCGMEKNVYAKWKHLRKTKHDHNPVNDCLGNCEALIHMVDQMGLNISLE